MPTFSAPVLERFAHDLFVASGTPADLAAIVARSLVAADLRGHESHGVMRATRYIGRIRDGTLQPAARPTISRRIAANAVVDGGWGFGQVAAHFSVQLAAELCREHGQAGVAISNAHHIGRLGEYAEALANAGLATIILTGGGTRGGSVAPFGGRQRLFGTNPIAMAVPTPSNLPPVVVDFASSAIPEGKIAVAQANQSPLPPGCVIDCNGRATTRPADFYAGGALLPFGGHKGSALVLMIELLSTILAGSSPIALESYSMGNPTLLLAWSVEGFVSRETFAARVAELLDAVRNSPPAPGFSEVLTPGELEHRTSLERECSGIPLSDGTWRELQAVAASLHVSEPPPHPAAVPANA